MCAAGFALATELAFDSRLSGDGYFSYIGVAGRAGKEMGFIESRLSGDGHFSYIDVAGRAGKEMGFIEFNQACHGDQHDSQEQNPR